ncbi:MAG: hypothetical protein Q8N23_09875 [Archangium sp.]|nr:hypothetical protein [Archangium sp.]MDP3569085.1 hypothetical protein [Archangium sp.]
MPELLSPIGSRVRTGLSLLAVGWGLGLSYAAFQVSLLVAQAIHLPAAREYFGSDVSISDEEIFEATLSAVLGVFGYLSAWAIALWVTGRQPDPLRGWLRLCVALPAAPGALLALGVILIGTLFIKGVA